LQFKDQFGAYPTGTGADGAHELVWAITARGVNVQSLVGAAICPDNKTLQDAWGNPIRYYYSQPPSMTVGGGYDAIFQKNNCTPVYVSPGPNGTFDGGGDDVIVP
jgi:hypothetical protein